MRVIEAAFSHRERDLAERSLHLSLRSMVSAIDCIQKDRRYPIYITPTKPVKTEPVMADIQWFDQTAPLAPNLTHDIRWLHAGQEFDL